MRRLQIGFWDVDSVLDFLKIISSFDYDADLVCGSYMVDAKSLMAVFSLKSSRNVELIIHSDCCDDLEESLECYIERGRLLNEKRAAGCPAHPASALFP